MKKNIKSFKFSSMISIGDENLTSCTLYYLSSVPLSGPLSKKLWALDTEKERNSLVEDPSPGGERHPWRKEERNTSADHDLSSGRPARNKGGYTAQDAPCMRSFHLRK